MWFLTQWRLKHSHVKPPAVLRVFVPPCASAVSSEVGRAVWLRFSPPLPSSGPQPSFMAHLSGAVVGISMGLLILRSYEESLQKQCSWWVIVFSFITFLLFAIFWNIFAYELLGVQIPPPPWWRATLALHPLVRPSLTLDPISSTLNMFTDSKQRSSQPSQNETNKMPFLLLVQSKCENRSFKSKYLPETFSTDLFANQRKYVSFIKEGLQ